MNEPGYLLALDAAYGKAAASLLCPDGQTLTAESGGERPHSQTILPLLEGLIRDAGIHWQQLDMLAVGQGPGMFTGIRIAVATMSGINAGLKRPMLGISSLAITAAQADIDEELWVIEDARAGDVYVGCYQLNREIHAPQCISTKELAEFTPAKMTGQQPPSLPTWAQRPLQISRAKALAVVISHQLESGVAVDALPRDQPPIYLQASQAERGLQP